MARTLKLYAPSGWSNVTVALLSEGDVVVQNVSMSEAANGKGIYRGTLTAPAGTYDASVFSDAGANHRGSYGYVRVSGVDPEVAPVGDAHGVPDGIKLGKQVTETNQAGDTHDVTRVET